MFEMNSYIVVGRAPRPNARRVALRIGFPLYMFSPPQLNLFITKTRQLPSLSQKNYHPLFPYHQKLATFRPNQQQHQYQKAICAAA